MGSNDRPTEVYTTDALVEELAEVCSVKLAPGLVMLDTGCRKACGGRRWHKAIRRELDHLDISYKHLVLHSFHASLQVSGST